MVYLVRQSRAVGARKHSDDRAAPACQCPRVTVNRLHLLLVTRWVPECDERDMAGIPAAASARGHRVEILGAEHAYRASAMANTADAVICRFSNDREAILASDALARSGHVVIGGGAAVAVGDDQAATLQALWQDGVPTPETVVVDGPGDFDAAARLGWPVVTKQTHTMGGVGVSLAHDDKAIWAGMRHGSRLIVQRFHAESAGEDKRLLVVGNRVTGAIRRQARDGDFRANLWLGGRHATHDFSRLERDLALRAAAAVGLDVAGVDLIDTRLGPLVIEVNPNPGVTGLPHTAAAIVRHAERRVAARQGRP